MGLFLSRSFDQGASFLRRFLCSIRSLFLRPDPRFAHAGARRSCQGWPSRRSCSRRCPARPQLDGFEHDGMLAAVGMTIRGEPASGHESIAPQPCIGWVQGPNHDAVMRIGGEAPKRRTHSSLRRKPRNHVGTPPPRTVIGDPHALGRSWRVPSLSSVHYAERRTMPCGTMPSRTNCHRPIRSLRAKATIMVLRVPLAFSVPARNHCAQALVFWNIRKRHANWIMPRRTRALPERANPFSRRFLPLSSGEPVRPA
jgi:hypothetical protein